jgi:hypothetical protein
LPAPACTLPWRGRPAAKYARHLRRQTPCAMLRNGRRFRPPIIYSPRALKLWSRLRVSVRGRRRPRCRLTGRSHGGSAMAFDLVSAMVFPLSLFLIDLGTIYRSHRRRGFARHPGHHEHHLHP